MCVLRVHVEGGEGGREGEREGGEGGMVGGREGITAAYHIKLHALVLPCPPPPLMGRDQVLPILTPLVIQQPWPHSPRGQRLLSVPLTKLSLHLRSCARGHGVIVLCIEVGTFVGIQMRYGPVFPVNWCF